MKSLIILLFLAPLTLIAQQSAGEWHLGLSGSFEASAMTISDEDESSIPQYGFSSGLIIGYTMDSHITWFSGITYGIKNISHTQGGYTFGSDLDPTTGFTGTSEIRHNIQLSDIEFPIQMKYFFFNQFYMRAGLGINFLNERTVDKTIHYTDGLIEPLLSNPRSYMNYSTTLGFGYTQPIGEKLNFNFDPFIKYYFIENIIPMTHLYNIGVNASLTLKL